MQLRLKGVAVAALATMLLAGSAMAQERGRGFGGGRGGGGTMLLRMPEVQTELKLTEEQKTKLTEMLGQGRGGPGNGGGQDLSREERQKQAATRRAEREKQLAAIMNADQMKRYRQLQLQQQGASALGETAVQEELKLTADQKTKVEAIVSEQSEAMRSARESAAGDREGMRAKTAEIRKKSQEKLEALLTEDQKTQWKAMLGTPFTFPTAPRRNTDAI